MEGDQYQAGAMGLNLQISIHTLRMEGDVKPTCNSVPNCEFQSTPSAWRVTAVVIGQTMQISISIHTLRMEGDMGYIPRDKVAKNFNPHPPRGG